MSRAWMRVLLHEAVTVDGTLQGRWMQRVLVTNWYALGVVFRPGWRSKIDLRLGS